MQYSQSKAMLIGDSKEGQAQLPCVLRLSILKRADKQITFHEGARVLRQDPVECLFQFVCSSNNHISRIHGMVERLCRAYGTPLPVVDKATAADLPEVPGLKLHAVLPDQAWPPQKLRPATCHRVPVGPCILLLLSLLLKRQAGASRQH